VTGRPRPAPHFVGESAMDSSSEALS
jgi:hypothetical protein